MLSSCSTNTKSYSLSYSSSDGGVIVGKTDQVVDEGKSGEQVTALAINDDWRFVSLDDGNTSQYRTDEGITSNVSFTANFSKIDYYILNYCSSDGGFIEGNKNQRVEKGQDGSTVTAHAESDYEFTSWNDGVTNASRTDTSISADLSVTASFIKDVYYSINYSAGEGGFVTGDTNQTIEAGLDGTEVKAIPLDGYEFTSWSDGKTDASRKETDVLTDLSLTAKFTKKQSVLFLVQRSSEGEIDGESS